MLTPLQEKASLRLKGTFSRREEETPTVGRISSQRQIQKERESDHGKIGKDLAIEQQELEAVVSGLDRETFLSPTPRYWSNDPFSRSESQKYHRM